MIRWLYCYVWILQNKLVFEWSLFCLPNFELICLYKVILYHQMHLKNERLHLNLHEEINKFVYTGYGQMITAGQVIAYEKFISGISFILSFLLGRKSEKGLWIFINDSLLIIHQWTVYANTLCKLITLTITWGYVWILPSHGKQRYEHLDYWYLIMGE